MQDRETLEQHAVIVQIPYGFEFGFADAIDDFYEPLSKCLKDSGKSEFDGYELEREFVAMYAYGSDAWAMFKVIEPLIRCCCFPDGAIAVLRFGEGLLEPVTTMRILLQTEAKFD